MDYKQVILTNLKKKHVMIKILNTEYLQSLIFYSSVGFSTKTFSIIINRDAI